MDKWIMATQYIEEFKKDAARYWKDHSEPEPVIGKCARNPGISSSFLSAWVKTYDENEASVS